MKKYKHILFDLDHTLWDFEKNSNEVLCHLYDQYNLPQFGMFSKIDFTSKFKTINHQLWDLYAKGQIDKEAIRSERFKLIMNDLGMFECTFTEELSNNYLQLCPQKENVMPYTYDVLNYLCAKYTLHIVTNGFEDVQSIKMKSAKLNGYFTEIITSERAGANKPNPAFFNFTLQNINATCHDCILVGDSLEADIVGARSVCIDHVYFNPAGNRHKELVTYEIACLSELMYIL